MDFAKIVKQAFDIAILKEEAMKKVAADKDALVPALLVVAFVSIVTAFGFYVFPSTFGSYIFYRPDLSWLIGKAVWAFVLNVVSLYLMAYLAVTLFKSKLSIQSYVQVMGHAMIVGLISIVPSFTVIGGIWGLVVMWHILTKLGKLEAAEIIVLFVINIVVLTVLTMSGIGFMF